MDKIIHATHKPIDATICIPGSKSISNRALLLSALAQGTSILHGLQISDDIATLINALINLGVVISIDDKSQTATVIGNNGQFQPKNNVVLCSESGTLVRLLLAVCAAVSGCYHFDAAPSLRKRPLASLLNILVQQGVIIEPPFAETLPLTINSFKSLQGGRASVDGSQTSQTVSALLIASPYMASPLALIAKNLVSRSYVQMTCQMMKEFGVEVENNDNYYYVHIPQSYQARSYVIEPDWSTASYFFAAAAVTAGEVTIPNLSRKNTKQGDAIFLSILKKMGCRIMENSREVTVKGVTELQGLTVNMQDCPDLFMTLVAIAPFAKTPTCITGIAHARHKESDRLASMRIGLKQLGVAIEEGLDWFKVFPGRPKSGIGVIDAQNDHRIAMALSVLGLKTGLTIKGAECVAKSCPKFFELWKHMDSTS